MSVKISKIYLDMDGVICDFHKRYTELFGTLPERDDKSKTFHKNFDKFIEVLLGKTGSRIDLTKHKTISLIDLDSQEKLKEKIQSFKNYLVGLNENKAIASMNDTDLLNIRDELLGDLNQFLYLLTFK